MKNPKEWHRKWATDPCISLPTNLMNLGILLELTTSRITSRTSFGLQSVSTQIHDDLLSANLLNFCRSI
jgi:hypothetical protein